MKKFNKLFSTFDIGHLHLRNRIVMAPLGNNLSNEDGTVSDRALAYYAERAKGGAGLIITESSPTSKFSRHRAKCICAYDDSFLPGLKRLVEVVHSYGTAIALQLIHAGRMVDSELTGTPPVAPSPVPRWPDAPVPKALEIEEIYEIIGDFGSEARRAKEAGFDAVEIHGAHGYLIHDFLSPRINKRKDAYGGTSEKRLRFAIEVVRRVREEVGPSYPIIFRLSAKEYVEGGYDLNESLDWCKELEREGVNVIHITGGTNETLLAGVHAVSPMMFPLAYHAASAEAVKRVVKIPVIAVGRINHPSVAEQILRKGQADLVSVGRAFLADPHWPAKAARGEEDRIRQCVACNQCVWTLYQQKSVICFQNAAVGREEECQILPAKKAKKVVVIGGGLAGLEAARVAKKRGHHVTLFEKTSRLGGQFLLASVPPFKQELMKAVEWLIREVEKEGVKVKLNTEVKVETIQREKPDAIIVATGASPLIPIEFSVPNVLTAWEVLAGKETGKEVLVLGGGMVGSETAEFLVNKGCRVTIVEMLDSLTIDMDGIIRALLLERLAESTVSIMLSSRVKEIRDGKVVIIKNGKDQLLSAETIVLALGSRSNRDLIQALDGKVQELMAIGDCVEPRRAKDAIHEGFFAGLHVGSKEER